MPLLLSVVGVGLTISQLSCKPLNLLLLGEEQAMSLGLSVIAVRCYLIFSASLLAGGITAFCGPIAFLGVAVPHLGRSLFRTQDHRLLVPVVVLLGALLALVGQQHCPNARQPNGAAPQCRHGPAGGTGLNLANVKAAASLNLTDTQPS